MNKLVLSFAVLTAFAMPAFAGETITVTHGKTPDPTYIDLGPAGDSVGDQRIWEFPGKTAEGGDLVMDWLMITTGQAEASPDLENRMTSAVFSFGGSDRILLEGIGVYPRAGATVKVDATLERTLHGDRGAVRLCDWSIAERHLPDGTWQPAPDAMPNERARPLALKRQLEGVARLSRGEPHHLATLPEAFNVQEIVEGILSRPS